MIPKGWRLVPEKPTRAQLLAAQKAWLDDPLRRTSTLYQAALDAAPEPPTMWQPVETAPRDGAGLDSCQVVRMTEITDTDRLEWIARRGDVLRHRADLRRNVLSWWPKMVNRDDTPLDKLRRAVDEKIRRERRTGEER